jgi:hypothetical protein
MNWSNLESIVTLVSISLGTILLYGLIIVNVVFSK